MGCSTWNLDSCLIRFRKLQLIVIITFHKLLVPSRLCPATATAQILYRVQAAAGSPTQEHQLYTRTGKAVYLVEISINSVLWLDINIIIIICIMARRIIADSGKV